MCKCKVDFEIISETLATVSVQQVFPICFEYMHVRYSSICRLTLIFFEKYVQIHMYKQV